MLNRTTFFADPTICTAGLFHQSLVLYSVVYLFVEAVLH